MIVAKTPRTGRGPIPITFIISVIHSEQAGTEGHILRLIRALPRERFDPKLVVMQESAWSRDFDDPLVPTEVLGFRSWSRPSDWFRVSELAKRFRDDGTQIVELHSIDAQVMGGFAAGMAKVPKVISCRRNAGHEFGFKERLLTKLANRNVTQFLANSACVADRISKLEGVERERFAVIHNGVDLEKFDQAALSSVTNEFETKSKGKQVVSIVANLRPVKNHACFLAAAKHIAKQHTDVVFAVMGSGPLENDLKRQADQLGIADRMIWLGSVGHPAPYLRRSNVACLTSHSEGFSNSIVEYMAAGVPVVATDVGGAKEAIVEDETGFLVPAGDAKAIADRISKLLSMNEENRKQFGTAGRKRVELLFSMDAQLQAFEALYCRELQLAGV